MLEPSHRRPPNDLLDEVETELQDAYDNLGLNRSKITALEELHTIVHAVATRFDRPITVSDVIQAAELYEERERRLQLIRELRRPAPPAATSPPVRA